MNENGGGFSVRYSELLDELGISHREGKKVRENHLLEGTHWKRLPHSQGRGGPAVWLSRAGEAQVRIYQSAMDSGSPQAIQAFRKAQITKVFPNPAWVEVLLDDGETRCNCAVHPRFSGRYRRGMDIEVEVVIDNTGITCAEKQLVIYQKDNGARR